MTASEILRAIEARGVSARVENGALKLRPAAALDAAALAQIRDAKPQIIALLQQRESATPSAYETPREYSQEQRDALATLAREVEAARVGAWCKPTARVLAAWRAAESICGPLTLSGNKRREYSRSD